MNEIVPIQLQYKNYNKVLTPRRIKPIFRPRPKIVNYPKLDSRFMTVCIGAICEGSGASAAFAIADKMLSTDTNSFEPRKDGVNAGSKITAVTHSVAVMFSGDPGTHIEILNKVTREVWSLLYPEEGDRSNRTVEEVAQLYCDFYNSLRTQRINNDVLSKYNLTMDYFREHQGALHDIFVQHIVDAIDSYTMPPLHVIVTGVDQNDQPHIYVINNGRLLCCDQQGYAAIGIGSEIADAVFMRHGYHKQFGKTEACYIAYLAKKQSEAAPGVGERTDMGMVLSGQAEGEGASFGQIPTSILTKLGQLYKERLRKEDRLWKEQNQTLAETLREGASMSTRRLGITDEPFSFPPLNSP